MEVLHDMQAAITENVAENRIHGPTVVLLIMAQFGEKQDSLLLLADPTATVEEVESTMVLPDSPRLIVLGESLMKGEKWMVSAEGCVQINMSHSHSSFIAALAVLFASYYCFNLEYQEGAAVTLEFIQRCFMCINPSNGSKYTQGKRKKNGKEVQRNKETFNPHVAIFINKLADYEWKCKSLNH